MYIEKVDMDKLTTVKTVMDDTLKGKGQVNSGLLPRGEPDFEKVEKYSIEDRIWLAVADRFTSNCNEIMIEDDNIEFFKKEFGVDNAEQIIDWYGFLYEVSPGHSIEVMSGPDESEVVPISQVEMMEFNERYKETSNSPQRRELLLELMGKYSLY